MFQVFGLLWSLHVHPDRILCGPDGKLYGGWGPLRIIGRVLRGEPLRFGDLQELDRRLRGDGVSLRHEQ